MQGRKSIFVGGSASCSTATLVHGEHLWAGLAQTTDALKQ